MDEGRTVKQISYIEKRVTKIEDSHADMSQLIRDFQKDFHILTSNLGEVKDVLSVISETSISIAVFKQRYESNREADKEATKRIHARLDAVEKNSSKVAWTILSAVILAVVSTVIVKG